LFTATIELPAEVIRIHCGGVVAFVTSETFHRGTGVP
jgi:hypothetical protein